MRRIERGFEEKIGTDGVWGGGGGCGESEGAEERQDRKTETEVKQASYSAVSDIGSLLNRPKFPGKNHTLRHWTDTT